MVLPLSRLSPGERGCIVWIASENKLKESLYCLGFLPGETLTCVLQDSHQYLKAYRIRDTLIALRRETANEIFVQILTTPTCSSS